MPTWLWQPKSDIWLPYTDIRDLCREKGTSKGWFRVLRWVLFIYCTRKHPPGAYANQVAYQPIGNSMCNGVSKWVRDWQAHNFCISSFKKKNIVKDRCQRTFFREKLQWHVWGVEILQAGLHDKTASFCRWSSNRTNLVLYLHMSYLPHHPLKREFPQDLCCCMQNWFPHYSEFSFLFTLSLPPPVG